MAKRLFPGTRPEPSAAGAEAARISESMSPDQLAGQVMMIGYYGEKPSPEIIRWIRENNIGGIKIFGWNADNLEILKQSIDTMQAAASETEFGIPLFVATDQEGGWVRHIKGNSSITPGNMALGASGIINDSYRTGYYIGEELRLLGINMNFAPTVDILINHDAHVIGPRAFSDDPLHTAILATSYANGMKKAGIICTAKHFPGHGRTEIDSHGWLPVIETELDELMETDLLPYDFLIREGLPAVMSGHIAFPNITGDKTPASLSPYFLKEVLREKMGFDGIIITDDMQMNGALYKSTIIESCLSALKAGNDMVMISRNLDDYGKIRELIIREIETDSSFEKQLRESVKRIVRAKLEYSEAWYGFSEKEAEEKRGFNTLPTEEASSFFRQQAYRSVSLIYSDRPLPPVKELGKTLIAGQLRLFFDEGLKRFPKAHTYFFPYSPFYRAREADLAQLPGIAKQYDTVIFCTANPAAIELLESLEKTGCRVIVLSVLSPAYFAVTDWPDSGVAVYGTGRESVEAGFAAIAGEFIPEGTIPISMEKVY